VNPEENASIALEKNPDQVAEAIKAVFSHPQAGTVLVWLMETCSATRSALDENPFVTAATVGRQEVWHALNAILSMDSRDIGNIRRDVAVWEAGQNE
jgi:hypothetical protein|tara:strand:- start:61 stop:351 length:291 start_codon:yes stop_codon:yes gene_type:complete